MGVSWAVASGVTLSTGMLCVASGWVVAVSVAGVACTGLAVGVGTKVGAGVALGGADVMAVVGFTVDAALGIGVTSIGAKTTSVLS